MRDEWTKQLPNGQTVSYTPDIEPGTGGIITAKKGDVVQSSAVKVPMTREQVEAEFRDLR